jgi:signal transduction histidine kinase
VWQAALAAALLLLLLCGCMGAEQQPPMAAQGKLDLSGWDVVAKGPVELSGQWEFYWDQLLPASAFGSQQPLAGAAYLSLPASWNMEGEQRSFSGGSGVATFRLRVTTPQGLRQPMLRLDNITSAYALWVDGRLTATAGTLGLSSLTERAEPSRQLVPLPPIPDEAPRTMELVLQVSNHHYRDGGVLAPILFGPAEALLAGERQATGFAMFLVGALFIMGVYHLALYCFRPATTAPLSFAAYCLLWMLNYATSDTSGWVIRILAPSLPAHLLDQIALGSCMLSVPVGYYFFHTLYPREFSRRVFLYCAGTTGIFLALALGASSKILTTSVPLFYASTCGLILYSTARLYRALRLGREGSAFLFAGFLQLGLIGINDMLFDLHLIRSTSLIAPGMLVFILCQAFALSRRLSQAFCAVESLSGQLEQQNLNLEAEIAERSRLERQIINISEDERRRMSQDLHDGLCQLLTAARLRCAVLSHTERGEKEARELSQLSYLLDELVDQAYDLSHGLWPLEHGPEGVGPSLQDMIQRFSRASGVPIAFQQDRICENCPNPDVTQLFRIAQEALTNAVKHAQPKHISVRFRCRPGGQAILTISDDGIGRAKALPTKGGLGMGIMSHRARMIGGELSIEDVAEGGTLVTCTIACNTQHIQRKDAS